MNWREQLYKSAYENPIGQPMHDIIKFIETEVIEKLVQEMGGVMNATGKISYEDLQQLRARWLGKGQA